MSEPHPLQPDLRLFESNLQAIAARGTPPAPLGRIHVDRSDPLLVVAVGGQPILCRRNTAQQVLALEDAEGALRAARQWRDGLSDVRIPGGHLILIGPGMGHYLQAILEKADEDTLLWIVEPSPQAAGLLLGLLNLEPALRHPRIRWSLAETPEEFAARLLQGDSQKRLAGQGVQILPTPITRVLYPELLPAYQKAVGHSVELTRMILQSTALQQRCALENLKANLRSLPEYRGLRPLSNALAGIPAVLVGAGPSLEDNIESLAAVASRVAIIAVDTAHRALRRAGIRPDAVVCMDFTQLNARHLEDGPIGDEILIAYPGVDPSIIERFPVENVVLMQLCGLLDRRVVSLPLPRLLGLEARMGTVRTGGSTAHAALSVARTLGVGPVYLLGVDLAFPGERLYAQGAVQLELDGIDPLAHERCQVPSNDGKMVLTSGMFQEYIREMAILTNSVGIDVYNLASKGARLGSIPYMTWESFESGLPQHPAAALRHLRSRLKTAPAITTPVALDAACVALRQLLERAASENSKRQRRIKALEVSPTSGFRERFVGLMGPLNPGTAKDDLYTMLIKYVEPCWAEFIGHGDGVGYWGGRTAETNHVARERLVTLLRELGRATKTYRETLDSIRAGLRERYGRP